MFHILQEVGAEGKVSIWDPPTLDTVYMQKTMQLEFQEIRKQTWCKDICIIDVAMFV